MIDIHNHIIPGIDDGADSLSVSLQLLTLAVEDGISRVVCTPHMHPGRFDNNRDTIEPVFNTLKTAVQDQQLPVDIAMAAEVRISDEFMMQLKRGKVPFIGQWEGDNSVLLEMPHQNIPVGIENLLNWLQRQNIRAVIAHPERNKEVMQYPQRAQKLAERGALFQLTAGAVAGYFGSQAQETSRWLLDHQLAQFVASDAHHPTRRPPAMKAAAQVLDNWFDESLRIQLTHTHPHTLTTSLFEEQA